MNYHILLSFIPFVLILLLSLSLFALLSKFLKDKSFFLLLSIFLATPLLIGLFLYLLFFIFPGHAKLFYILAISLPIFFLTFWERRNLFLVLKIIFDKWKILKSQPLDLFSKIILLAVLFVLILVFLRTILWPISWVDQIYYLNQAYVFAQTRSLDLFFNWGFFHDSYIYNYRMNPAIRPGLPMIFTTTFLFNNSLRDAQFFCQTIIFYYFLITSSVVFYVNWKIAKIEKIKSALIALFLMLFTYIFIYYLISGFKEMLIIPITILIIFYISNQENILAKLNPWIYIGILTGLMSFINYSGTLISMLILLIFILSKGVSFQKIISAAKILLLIIVFSGFEFFVFLNLIKPNLSSYLSQKETTIITKQPDNTAKTNTNKDNFPAFYSSAAKGDFAMFNLTSLKDLYLKGKFQWFFQIQYYGLIFILFIVVAIATYKKLIKNRFIKNTLFFLLIYGLLFFDPLNINRNQFAYVLSISSKYPTLLVPFIAIVIAYQFDWMDKILKRIKPDILIVALSSFFILDFIFFKNNLARLFKIISVFFPTINDHVSYMQGLKSLNDLYLIMLATLLIPLAYFYLAKRKKLFFLFNNTSIVTALFLLIFFALPFLFFYNSNFGLVKTFAYSFSKNSIKLEKTIGYEELYLPLRYVNSLPRDKKVLFIDQPIKSIDIYLNIPMNNIYQLLDFSNIKNLDAIRQMGISYIYAKNNSQLDNKNITEITDLKLIKQIGKNLILEVKP